MTLGKGRDDPSTERDPAAADGGAADVTRGAAAADLVGGAADGDAAGTAPGAEPRALDASALKAYAHPLRMRMIRYLADHGSATATELARVTGESTGQTSYHLRQLARHGLIEDDPHRGTGRERWWRPASFSVDAAAHGKDPSTAPAARMVLSAMVEGRAETLERWVSAPEPPREWVTASLHDQRTFELTAAELDDLGKALQEVLDRYRELSRERRTSGTAPEGAARVRTYVDAFPLLHPPT
jgi:DNA-binding transcriptional ArsR family regulator